MTAIVVIFIYLLIAAGTTTVDDRVFGDIDDIGRDNTSRNSDDGVTKNHDDAGEELTETSGRGDVTIAYGSKGDDGPIDALRYARKLRARDITLNDIHQHAEDANKNNDEEEIYEYARDTPADAFKQKVAFVDVREELEDTEYAYQAERTEDAQIAQLRHENTQQHRPCGNKVNDAEEAHGVFALRLTAISPQHIFHTEEERQEELQTDDYGLDDAHDRDVTGEEMFKGVVFDDKDTLKALKDEAEHHGTEDAYIHFLGPHGVVAEEDIIESSFIVEDVEESFHWSCDCFTTYRLRYKT